MKELVIFYSRADENYFQGEYRYVEIGNTEKAAKIISEETGAGLFKIEQNIPYAADYQTCIRQAKEDLKNQARPELRNLPDDLSRYQKIYLGYPNYWGELPMAVYTFLESFDWHQKIICPFCTHEGSGLSQTEDRIKQICKGAIIRKGLALMGSEVDQCKDRIYDWLQQYRHDKCF